jgi:hypothetical protein
MWLVMRSIRSAGLVGSRAAPRWSCPVGHAGSRWAKKSRTAQSVGCTVSSTRSNTAKPTGLVSIESSALRAEASVPCVSSTNSCVAAGAGGQAAEHQQVVPRGVVEVAGQLVVQQVGHVQVDQLAARPALQRGLQVGGAHLEHAARAAHPQEAVRRQHVGQRVEFDEAVRRDVEDAHQALAQLARGVEREVGQHAVGAGALEGQQRFHHHQVVVQPAVGGGGLQHRVFAAHLVGEGRHAELVLHAAHDVQVRHAGLDHHHVGAFGQVQRHLAQRLVGVAGVHLVDLLVALAQVAAEPTASRKGP